MSNALSNNIIQCEALTKTYTGLDVAVLNGINLQVSAGEQIAIVGASGSGKSTLLHLLGGLDQPSSGQVKLMGQALQTLSETEKGELRNQSLGFVYQFHHLSARVYSVGKRSVATLDSAQSSCASIEQAAEMLTKVGLKHRLEHMPGELGRRAPTRCVGQSSSHTSAMYIGG